MQATTKADKSVKGDGLKAYLPDTHVEGSEGLRYSSRIHPLSCHLTTLPQNRIHIQVLSHERTRFMRSDIITLLRACPMTSSCLSGLLPAIASRMREPYALQLGRQLLRLE